MTADRFFDRHAGTSHRLVGLFFAGALGVTVWRDIARRETRWWGYVVVRRDERPLAFWWTMTVNAALGLLFLLLGLGEVSL